MKKLINKVEQKVKQQSSEFEGGHDWQHIDRVRKLALVIAESVDCNTGMVELAALLHEVGDQKLVDEKVTYADTITKWLGGDLSANDLDWLIKIAESVSWSKQIDSIEPYSSTELHIVQDADRIEALGAIGIARAFSYGGSNGLPMYKDSEDLLDPKHNYGLHHIHQKYFKIYESLHFEKSRSIARPRHDYVIEFSKRFIDEWQLTKI